MTEPDTTKPTEGEDDLHLREALKRCSPPTYLAAREFRKTGSFDHLPAIVHGVVERYVDREFRSKMRSPSDELRLAEDLGLDSLSMMEIVMLRRTSCASRSTTRNCGICVPSGM